MPRAEWNGAVIAESERTVVLEGNHYFPPDSIAGEYLVESDHTTRCPWKGKARYYSIEVDGKRNDNAAWYYPKPTFLARKIKDHVAFWKGVHITG